jgi:hypothetical protein
MREQAVKQAVINCDPRFLYVGRGPHKVHMNMNLPLGAKGWLGNPHTVGFCPQCGVEHVQGEAAEAFRDDFYARLEREKEFKLYLLDKGQQIDYVVCWCAPRKCHGDIIAAWLNKELGREDDEEPR